MKKNNKPAVILIMTITPLLLGLFINSCEVQQPVNTITDIDGNIYTTVIIGEQEWMAGNLKTTRYNDGTEIPNVIDDDEWSKLSTGAYVWYDHKVIKGETYGGLYNWYAVETGKLCPEGWHVPSDEDWDKLVLTVILMGRGKVGPLLKSSGTIKKNTGLWYHSRAPKSNNRTGFSAIPGGYRNTEGFFSSIGYIGYWYSSTEYNETRAWYRHLRYDSNDILGFHNKNHGFSIRCMRDIQGSKND